MIDIEVLSYTDSDKEEAKRFIKDVKEYLSEYFNDTGNEIGNLEMLSSDYQKIQRIKEGKED